MKISTTLAALVGCAALAACSGSNDQTTNADNGMMMDNLGTTDMNMGTDMNVGTTDMNMGTDMNAGTTTDMNTGTDINATGDTTNAAGTGNTTG